MRQYLFLLLFLAFLTSCGDGILRGREVLSKDQRTYLIIEDNNGGGCGPILIDGQPWDFKIGEAGEIKPGVHIIECGGKLEFEVMEGTIFYFDYWGP